MVEILAQYNHHYLGNRIIMLLLRYSLSVMGWVMAQTAHAQSDAHTAVLAAEHNRFEAMTDADTTALRAGLHPDLLYIHSNGLEESDDGLVASVAAGDIVYQAFNPLQAPQVQVLGKTALVDGAVRVLGHYRGTAFDVPLRYTSVYHRRRDRWQLIRWQSLKLVQE